MTENTTWDDLLREDPPLASKGVCPKCFQLRSNAGTCGCDDNL